MKSPTREISALWLVLLASGCASFTSAGIQKREAVVLERSYYWKTFGYPTDFPDTRIEKLFVRSLDDSLDGEYAETHEAQLVWALSVVGDKHFSDLLSQQPLEVQRATLRYMSSLWNNHKMRYPLTEALGKQ